VRHVSGVLRVAAAGSKRKVVCFSGEEIRGPDEGWPGYLYIDHRHQRTKHGSGQRKATKAGRGGDRSGKGGGDS